MLLDTTVVVPTRNRRDMLCRAILSVSKQKLLPKKVIIVDDCSDVPVSAEFFLDITNLEIEIIHSKVSLGGAVSRNIGVEHSETEFISFLDDDDAWDSCYLSGVSKILEENLDCNIGVYTSKKFVLSTSLDHVIKENIAVGVIGCDQLLFANSVGTTSCVTVRKQSLVDVGCFDKNLPALQDYDCWLRLTMNAVRFYPVQSAFVYYTINVSAKQVSGNYNNHIKARSIMLNKNMNKLSGVEKSKLDGLLTFFVAKAIHRKNYFSSLRYTLRAIFLTKKLKVFALLIPYRVFVFLGLYTS